MESTITCHYSRLATTDSSRVPMSWLASHGELPGSCPSSNHQIQRHSGVTVDRRAPSSACNWNPLPLLTSHKKCFSTTFGHKNNNLPGPVANQGSPTTPPTQLLTNPHQIKKFMDGEMTAAKSNQYTEGPPPQVLPKISTGLILMQQCIYMHCTVHHIAKDLVL